MATKKKPATVQEAMKQMNTSKLTEEEAAEMEEGPEEEQVEDNELRAPAAEQPEIPDWVKVPHGFKIPPGRTVSFLRFRADWTDTPGKGERQCVLWNLTGADEKLAVTRSRGDTMRLASELAKQTIRAIDGQKSNWSGDGKGGSVDVWWDAIGAKCRQLLITQFSKTHSLTEGERADFFEHCIAVRSAG
jgi:hypothetical protein